jgi:hypothetical protein
VQQCRALICTKEFIDPKVKVYLGPGNLHEQI